MAEQPHAFGVPWEQTESPANINYMRHRARAVGCVISFAGGFQNNARECPHAALEGVSPLLDALGGCPRCTFVRWSNWFALVDASSWSDR